MEDFGEFIAEGHAHLFFVIVTVVMQYSFIRIYDDIFKTLASDLP